MKSKKRVVLATILIVVAAQILIAQAVGINIIDLVNGKTESMAAEQTIDTSALLEQAKHETLADTSTYIDGYLIDIQQALEQYTRQETEAAKLKIKQKAQEIKDVLDANKPQAIENGKTKIKIKIDEDLNSKLTELDEQLSIQIQQKFDN